LVDRHWHCAVAAGRLHMCDAVVGRIVAWLALVVEGRMLLLLLVLLVVVLRRRAVGMGIHDAGTGVRERAAGMNWLA
jgi:hypothetical protein